ncbi:hypothetical protein LJR231_005895 [Phyllobacterium sp. LjRoot231]|uniref:hypothetical protein n=1 Tax=Phyllobacterium sp. LjRoot231 TaxID=3342289 RepID=UPI003ECD697A
MTSVARMPPNVIHRGGVSRPMIRGFMAIAIMVVSQILMLDAMDFVWQPTVTLPACRIVRPETDLD